MSEKMSEKTFIDYLSLRNWFSMKLKKPCNYNGGAIITNSCYRKNHSQGRGGVKKNKLYKTHRFR
jgi:hypothetical protein